MEQKKLILFYFFISALFFRFLLSAPGEKTLNFDMETVIRAYYLNDQRIEWSGVEASFGVEGAIFPQIKMKSKDLSFVVRGEILLNQPFGENILKDENRQRFFPNYRVNTLDISQLYFEISKRNFFFYFGKKETPFGRFYEKLFSNARFDAPFVRTEAILWRETGFFLKHKKGVFLLDLAITNGEENRDTNSSKALIARIGIETEKLKFGISGKIQDGIGSENQKIFNNHLGLDFVVILGHFSISGEAIYDEYGFHREYSGEIFWPHSIYYREVFYSYKTPVKGVGAYISANWQKDSLYLSLNYGEYHPQKIGNPLHDEPVKRLVIKASKKAMEALWLYFVFMLENKRPFESWQYDPDSWVVLAGIQFSY